MSSSMTSESPFEFKLGMHSWMISRTRIMLSWERVLTSSLSCLFSSNEMSAIKFDWGVVADEGVALLLTALVVKFEEAFFLGGLAAEVEDAEAFPVLWSEAELAMDEDEDFLLMRRKLSSAWRIWIWWLMARIFSESSSKESKPGISCEADEGINVLGIEAAEEDATEEEVELLLWWWWWPCC